MDASSGQHHHQEMGSQTLESMLVCTKAQQEKKPRPAEQALKCPRCDSSNTKFCYYNNYSLSQPRYFCKSCRRYWTKGGTLRNVPVGGGCRKNKRSSSSSKRLSSQDQPLISNNNSNPNSHLLASLSPVSPYDPNPSDHLSLAIARLQKQASSGKLGLFEDHHHHTQQHHEFPILGGHNGNYDGIGHSPSGHGLFDALRNGTYLESPNGFHGFYNSYANVGNGSLGNVENGGAGGGVSEEMEMPFEELHVATTTTTMATTTTVIGSNGVKQEMCNGRENQENRVLWGMPYQIGGDLNMADLDPTRQNWSGFGSSTTWHGLLNGPLM